MTTIYIIIALLIFIHLLDVVGYISLYLRVEKINQKLENDAKEKVNLINDVDKKVDLLLKELGYEFVPENIICNAVNLNVETIPAHLKNNEDIKTHWNKFDITFMKQSEIISKLEDEVFNRVTTIGNFDIEIPEAKPKISGKKIKSKKEN